MFNFVSILLFFLIFLSNNIHICFSFLFFFNDTATTEIYTLSLHDALPICGAQYSRPGDHCLSGHQPGNAEGSSATRADIIRNDCRMSLRRSCRMSAIALAGVCVLTASVLTACKSSEPAKPVSGGPAGSYLVAAGIHKIKHVIIVMQENRSFDSYFGTYPGADGIPVSHGSPSVCIPNPPGGCTRPYHDAADVNGGGPHGVVNSLADVHGGTLDGFI